MSINTISSRVLQHFTLVNIYGKSGTGKTTFALQLLSNYLPKSTKASKMDPRFVWVQGSEKFPKKRLIDMYKSDKRTVEYLQTHILLYPKFLITSYDELCTRLISLSQNYRTLPFTPRAIIIDNISHYLRLEISKYEDISLITALLDDFFDTVILPLIFYCGRRDITLILVHEVSYDPKKDDTVMFNHKLFSNLKSFNIELEKNPVTKRQVISFAFQEHTKTFRYRVMRKGIKLLT